MKTFSIFMVGTLFPLFSFAGGGQLGNGADAVVCTAGYKTTVELLDIYEARVLYGKTWQGENRGGTELELTALAFAKQLIAPLDTKLPVKSARLRKYLDNFLNEAIFLSGVELTDIPDSLQIVLPGGCRIVQMVIQTPNPQFGQKRYTINGDLWKLMEPSSRIGMLLHEVIYRDQISMGHTDSRWSRYFHALVFNRDIERMSKQKINDVLKEGLPQSFVHNGFVLLGSPNSDQDFFQVLRTTDDVVTPYPVIDGRYDLKADRLLDYTTDGPGEVFGITTENGFGAEVTDSLQISKAYLSQGRLSKSLWLGTSTTSTMELESIIINGLDASGNPNFEEHTTRVFGKFSNGVEISSFEGESGLKKGDGIEQWLTNRGCSNGLCKDMYFRLKFGELAPEDTYSEINLSYAKDEILKIQGFHNFYKFNKIPPSGAPAGFKPVTITGPTDSAYTVNFTSDGGFNFQNRISRQYGAKSTVALILRSGQIIDVPTETDYQLYFDVEGYLLKAVPL